MLHLQCADFNEFQIIFAKPLVNGSFFICWKIIYSFEVSFIESYNDGLIFEQRFQCVVQVNLLKDWIPALLWRVNKVNYTTFQMGQGCNWLHFNCVHLVKSVVQQSRWVYHLISQIFIFSMADIQCLSCEGIWLNFNIGLADCVNERRFSNIWIPCQKNCSFIRVDCWKTA